MSLKAQTSARWVDRSTLPITMLVQAAATAANVAPVVAAPLLLQALDLGTVAVGIYIAVVYVGAMLSGQVGGALVRRWGPIRASQISLAYCIAGLLLVGVPHLGLALLGAALLGAGYGPITPASSAMLARVTPPERYALVFSVKQTGVPLGAAMAALLTPVIVTHAGSTWALLTIAAICLTAALLAQTLRNTLDDLRDPASAFPAMRAVALPIRFVMTHPVLRALALCSLVFSLVQVSLSSYLVTFLHGELRWSLVAAGVALAVGQFAGVAGRIGWGVLADRTRSPRKTLAWVSVAMLVSGLFMPVFGVSSDHRWMYALMVCYGATATGWNGVYLATVARLVPPDQVAMATGGSLFFTYLGVVVGPPIFGWIGLSLGSLAYSFVLLAVPLALVVWKLARARWN